MEDTKGDKELTIIVFWVSKFETETFPFFFLENSFHFVRFFEFFFGFLEGGEALTVV
jgi:hypothetical protein